MTIEWRICSEYPQYEVSEFGVVRSLCSHARWKAGREKTQSDMNGYKIVKLPGNKTVRVHRLVAFAFLGTPPSEKHEVAHSDGTRINNHYSNLRWATRKENMQDAVIHGTAAYGERSGRCKIIRVEVEKIRILSAAKTITQQELADKFGISQAQISGIVNYKFWKLPNMVAHENIDSRAS